MPKNEKTQYVFKDTIVIILFAVTLILFIYFDVIKINLSKNKVNNDLLKIILSRLFGGLLLLRVIKLFGFKVTKNFAQPFYKSFIIILPCLLIAVNNLPIIALITGKAEVTATAMQITLLALSCVCVGLFEETAFRGIILPTILIKMPKNRKGIFLSVLISAAFFGLIHLLNLLSGASAISVIMQIGYSFLIGGMLGFVLVTTHNLWLCIALHAIYNFCGLLLPTLGVGSWWDLPTIIITVVLSIAVLIYAVLRMSRINEAEVKKIYSIE